VYEIIILPVALLLYGNETVFLTLREEGVSNQIAVGNGGNFITRNLPNVASEWLTHLLRIREVPVSNIGLKSGYPD
jgi:hypothetical protein